MHPSLTLITLDPILAIVGLVKEYLMTVDAVEVFVVAVCADRTELTDALLALGVVLVQTEFIAAGGLGDWLGLRGMLGLLGLHFCEGY
jgi:hypothetical protein